MIRVFLLLLACVASSWYVTDNLKQKGPGYVYIYFNDYSIETSFWFALFLFLVFFLIIFSLVKTYHFLVFYLKKLGYLPKMYGVSKAKKLEYIGTLAFLNQQWTIAAKQLSRAAKKGNSPFIDHVMAARAYLLEDKIVAAEKHYALANDRADKDESSLILLALDIAIAKGDFAAQSEILAKMISVYSDKSAVLNRAISAYSAQGKWSVLFGLLPKIKKYHVLPEAKYARLLIQICIGLMQPLTSRLQFQQLKSIWKEFPEIQSQPEVLLCYCRSLVFMGEIKEAQILLQNCLKKEWSNELIREYGLLKTENVLQQLEFAELFLLKHEDSVELLLSLGRLSKLNKYYGKAKDYLDRSIRILPSARAYKLLAEISDEQNDFVRAKKYLEEAVALIG